MDFIALKNSDKKNEVTLVLANNELHKQKGFVETVDGEFDQTTGNIAFRARFPNPEGILKHGSSGKIRLRNELKNAMIIPQKSTFEIQEKTCVYVVNKKNIIQMRTVVPSLRLPNFYVIESGLTRNDRILFEGIQNVKEGDKITPQSVSKKELLSAQSEL